MGDIYFFSEVEEFNLKNINGLKPILQQVTSDNHLEINELTIIFENDESLLEINKKYLAHDFYTDVITFDLSEKKEIEGEIYISIDRVKENSEKLGIEFNLELARIIIHGLLHLVGFNDKTEEGKKRMQKEEDKYLELYVSRETL